MDKRKVKESCREIGGCIMIKEEITIDDAIELLNSAVEADDEAIRELCFDKRVNCNEELSTHPTIQAHCYDEDGNVLDNCSVGVLGIINGLFGIDENGWGVIGAVLDDKRNIVEFTRLDKQKGD